MTDSIARSRRFTTPRLIIAALLLCVLGLAIAAYPSAQFFSHLFKDAVFPITEFDANSPTTVTLPDHNTRFIVMLKVEDTSDPLPSLELTIESDGAAIDTTEMNGWQTTMGHSYRTIASFNAPESLECTITVSADHTEDFGIFHHHTDMFSFHFNKVLPWWIGATVPFLSGIAIIFFVILRKVIQNDDIQLEL